MASTQTQGIPLSKISPAFLHANSTSHTWVFSAFAEIIDNAYDPDVSASELLIDKVDIRSVACLIFLDNGAGMDKDKLHKMLSFGFCEKDIYESNSSHQPIGHYGNGFKSGSMRIGTDALVFTRCEHSASIGFLSQTYLNAIKAESVFVPILEYRLPKLERFKSQESRNNLNAILTYSVFKFEEELKAELRGLEGSKTGTKIIISDLKRLGDSSELDFSSDPTDIRCPEAYEADMTSVYHRPVEQYTSEYKLSLREYCSILFLKPRMKITIRGKRVKSKLISKSLSQSEQDTYSPTWLTKPVKIIFGFTCEKERSEDYGLMLYHRNRLIKAFERVGYQKQANDRGVGVVGVAQVDFLQPIHNKQDFKWDEKFNSVMKAFATKLNEYWNEKMNTSNTSSSQLNGNLPDWTWAQCDQCLKWRRLPDTINPESLPDKWYCRYNADGTHNRCDIPEEPEDEDLAVKPKFEKTFKKRQQEQKKLTRQRMIEEEREKNEMKQQLRQKEEELKTLHRMKQQLLQRPKGEEVMLVEQMVSSAFPASPMRHNQQNGLKFPPPALSTPVSRSPNQQTKRRAIVQSLPTKENKKLCIKTEEGEVLAITRNFGDEEDTAENVHTSKKKSSISKNPAKNAPLRVAMPFQFPKTNSNEEKSKDVQGSKGKSSLSMAASLSTPSDHDVADVKPDKESLDEPMRLSTEENMKDEEQCAAEAQPSSGSADDQSNLETALVAIRERVDKKVLGNVDQHQERAAAVSTVPTPAAAKPASCRDEAPSTHSSLSHTEEIVNQPTQAAGSVPTGNANEFAETSENKNLWKLSCAGDKGSSHYSAPIPSSEPSGPPDFASTTEISWVATRTKELNSSSKKETEAVVSSGDNTLTDHPCASEKDSGQNKEKRLSNMVNNSENGVWPHRDTDVDYVSLSESVDGGSRPAGDSTLHGQDSAAVKPSHEFSTTIIGFPREQDEPHSPSSQNIATPALKQAMQSEVSQTSECSGFVNDKTLSGFVNCSSSPTDIDLELETSAKNRSDNSAAEGNSKSTKARSNHDTGDQQVPSPPQPSAHNTVTCGRSNSDASNISCSKFGAGDGPQTMDGEKNKSPFVKSTCSVYVQTESDHHSESTQTRLDKIRRNVYKLLQLLAPGKDLGDMNNIDELIEDMIRDEEHGPMSVCQSDGS